MVLKYYGALHKYIQTKMEFQDISSLGVAYRYAVKIQHKLNKQNKWEFRSTNPQKPKYGIGIPNSQNNQPQDNQSKPQEKKRNEKMKKETGKWCDFQKIPWHNTDEYHSKQSLVAKIKEIYQNHDSYSDLDNNKRR
jgi:hypothetical protein